MSEGALVSVIIPLYNAERYVEQCIHSILEQTWQNIEVIIVDDGSTDNSLAIAQKFGSEKVKIFTHFNRGASAARNQGLKLAKGDYIQFMDADDMLSTDKIAAQVNLLEENKECIAVCGTVYFDDGTDPYPHSPEKEWYSSGSDDPVDFLLKLYAGSDVMPGYGGMIQPNAWLTPKNLICKAGFWNEFRCPDDDGEFFCRVILSGNGVKYSDQGINFYRKFKTGKSWSGRKDLEALEGIKKSIDLKYMHLSKRIKDKLLDRIFARHYWELGIKCFPRYQKLSDSAIQKAMTLGYVDNKYDGGRLSKLIYNLFGWKIARIVSYLKNEI
ncbi:MAG TPA: glycosyltransferase family 2 protein [Mucilaginibacter sp.]|jgi:glycosyltransferase involved in cell wall biosynthesis